MQVHSYVGVFPIVNTTILPGLRLAESEDAEPQVQRNCQIRRADYTYMQIIYSAGSAQCP